MSNNNPPASDQNFIPIFLSGNSQKILLARDEDSFENWELFKVPVERILEDIKHRAAVSDLQPWRTQLDTLDHTSEVLFFADLEFERGQNFVFCYDSESVKNFLEENRNNLVDFTKDEKNFYDPKPLTEAEKEALRKQIGEKFDNMRVQLKNDQFLAQEETEYFNEHQTAQPVQNKIYEKNEKGFSNLQKVDSLDLNHMAYSLTEPTADSNKIRTITELTCDQCTGDSLIELSKAVQDLDSKSMHSKCIETDKFTLDDKKISEFLQSDKWYEILLSFEQKLSKILFEKQLYPNIMQNELEMLALWRNSSKNTKKSSHNSPSERFAASSQNSTDTRFHEIQTMSDLRLKDQKVSIITQHPDYDNLAIIATNNSGNYESQIEIEAELSSQDHLLNIWNMVKQPPEIITKINCDQQISCLSIHPSSHESIALGLKNGQICVKNLSINSAGNKNTDSIENFFDVYSNVSNSHRMAVTDIKWMPFEQKIDRSGKFSNQQNESTEQIVSCGKDGHIIFWSLKLNPTKSGKTPENESENIQKHVLTPIFQLEVKSNLPNSLNCSKFMFKMSICGESIQKDQQTFLYLGTEDGKLLSLDWAPTRSLDTGKLETPKAEVISERFSGETILLQESPFLRGCYLFVTKWNFSLWYDDYKSGPVISGASNQDPLTAACWSKNSPTSFFLAYQSGQIDVWNILSSIQKPVLKQVLFVGGLIECLTSIKLCAFGDNNASTDSTEYLAVGDSLGASNLYKLANYQTPRPEHFSQTIVDCLDKIKVETESRDAKLEEISRRGGDLGKAVTANIKGKFADGIITSDSNYALKNQDVIGDFDFDVAVSASNEKIQEVFKEFTEFESDIVQKYNFKTLPV